MTHGAQLVWQRVWALIIKEFMLVIKDPKSRVVIFVPPLIQFFIFSYAATFDLKQVEYAVLDESRSAESRELLGHLSGSPHFKLTRTLDSTTQIPGLINQRDVRLVLHVPPDFAKDLHGGRTARVQVIADGRTSNVAGIALGYLEEIVQGFSARMVQRQTHEQPGFTLVQRSWFNENLDSRWYIVSALGGIISMIIVMVLSTLSVAREREFGTFDQLLVAPFHPGEILIGKAVPCIFFGLVDALLLSVAAVYWFDIPFRGTIPALFIVLLTFMVAIVGVGLFISSISVTMQQGLLGSFVFIMPAVLLGGFTTPISNMPDWMQQATHINPLRYVVEGLRSIFLMGADTMAVWHDIWPMILIGCVTMPAASLMFRYRTQ